MQICCYNKCGVALEELNPHLPFGDHLLGNFFLFFDRIKRVFCIFHCSYYRGKCLEEWFTFQFKFIRGMLKNTKGLSDWSHKDCKAIYMLWKKGLWNKMNQIGVYNNNWIWRQIVKVMKEKHKIIMKIETNMQELQKPILKFNVQ